MADGWPMNKRYIDGFIIAFYVLAFAMIYLVEIEQLIIRDPSDFTYPLWPPQIFVDAVHWWGRNFHGVLWERPAWYKATIWVDVFISGPVYLAGIIAFARKLPWIKYIALIQAAMLLAIVIISIYAEIFGEMSNEGKYLAAASMVLWAVMPVVIMLRAMSIPDVSRN